MIFFYNKAKTSSYILLTKKKIISFDFNDKFYIRGSSLNNKINLDNENVIVENKLELKNTIIGNSISLSKTFLKHSFNEKLKFNNVNTKFFFKKNYIINFLNILTKSKTFLIITSTRKGGMSVFTNGIKGFLPRSHFYKITQKILCVPRYNAQSLFFFFNKKNKIIEQNLNIVFFPNFNLQLKFFIPKKFKNFNNKRKKKYRKKTKFNFVFLISKNINYEFKDKKNLEELGFFTK